MTKLELCFTILWLTIKFSSLSQCPSYIVGEDGSTFNYCGDETEGEMNIPNFPCGNFDMYVTVQFTTDGTPYPIEVWSDANYVDFPNSPTNIPHIKILDECDGQLLYSNNSGSCTFGGSISPPSPPGATEFQLMLNLPSGTYIAVIGYMNSTDLPFNSYFAQEGCISYTFGYPNFLELTDYDTDQVTDQVPPNYPPSKERKVRYEKIAIEGKGVFIRDRYTGHLYDLITRKIVE